MFGFYSTQSFPTSSQFPGNVNYLYRPESVSNHNCKELPQISGAHGLLYLCSLACQTSFQEVTELVKVSVLPNSSPTGHAIRVPAEVLASLDWWMDSTRVYGSSPNLSHIHTDSRFVCFFSRLGNSPREPVHSRYVVTWRFSSLHKWVGAEGYSSSGVRLFSITSVQRLFMSTQSTLRWCSMWTDRQGQVGQSLSSGEKTSGNFVSPMRFTSKNHIFLGFTKVWRIAWADLSAEIMSGLSGQIL